jgi:SAM-dependent methyltransferase
MPHYSMDPAWAHEKERLDAQASVLDPGTRSRIEALGINEGWSCAEVAGGSGTIAEWLCGRVGDTGSVVATDVDTRFLESLEAPNLQVHKHDIVHQALERDRYDLVHVRLLLMHLGDDRAAALAHMADAVKPGGWLLAEEQDNATAGQVYPPDRAQERVSMALGRVAAQQTVDQQCGRKLPAMLEDAGMVDVEADGRTRLLKQGTKEMAMATLFFRFQRDRIIETGAVEADEVDALLASYGTPGSRRMMAPLIVAAWGRKPS